MRLTKGARQWENTHVNWSSADQMAGLSPYCGPPKKVVPGERGSVGSRPAHKNLFLEFPKISGTFMLHFDR